MLRAALICSFAAASVALPAQTFDAPTRIKAGESFIGHFLDKRERLYPSPAMYDIDGDGNMELVVGDLFGSLTVTTRTKDGWTEEKKLVGADGEPLKFHNW